MLTEPPIELLDRLPRPDRDIVSASESATPGAGRRATIGGLFAKLVRLVMVVVTAALGLVMAGALTGRWGLIPVLTGSMRPGIQPGDLVLVMPEPLSAVRPGQVLDFQPPGQSGASVVHRVVAVTKSPNGPIIRTKGDANNVADSWHAQLGGTRAWRVRAVIPKLGYLAVFEHNPIGRLAVELALLGGGVGVALSVIWRRPPKDSHEQAAAGAADG